MEVKYELPASFAKCADAELSRQGCKRLFGESSEALNKHYGKYEKDAYIRKFTERSIAIITSIYIGSSQEELKRIASSMDARNFKSEVPKLDCKNA